MGPLKEQKHTRDAVRKYGLLNWAFIKTNKRNCTGLYYGTDFENPAGQNSVVDGHLKVKGPIFQNQEDFNLHQRRQVAWRSQRSHFYYWKSHHWTDRVAYSTNLEALVTQAYSTQISQHPFIPVSTLSKQPTCQGHVGERSLSFRPRSLFEIC